MKRYTHIVLRRMPPLNGFSIKTTEGKFLSDIRPRGIVRELNRLNDRIKRLEEELMDTKNKHAVLVADIVLNEDRAERIKRLEEALDTLTCVIGLTPIKGNLAALQEAFDMARAVLKAKEAKL